MPQPGRVLGVASWGGTLAFGATALPVALGIEAFDGAAVAVALALFFVSLVVWIWALVAAALRTARGDDVVVTTLFLLEGPVSTRVRWSLFGSLGICLGVVVASATSNPFGILVPMYPLGIVGLFGARHGEFPPRSPGRRR